MNSRVRRIDKELKRYDSLLFAQVTHPPRIDVYRKSSFGGHPPHLVISLTDNWNHKGRPVEWGLEPLITKIKSCDLWHDDRKAEKAIEATEKQAESNERARRGLFEDIAYDNRREFQRKYSDVNTSNLPKTNIGEY